MRKIISAMHISLDGFVAGSNGEMDWMTVNEEIFNHLDERIKQGNTALYGRVTFQMMEDYWPTAVDKPGASNHEIQHSQWYSKIHKVVLSKTMNQEGLTNTTIISDNLEGSIKDFKNQDGGEVLIFGSPTATHSLQQLDLIDGYWLFVNPVVLGQGIPLFVDIREKITLKLLNTKQFVCGVTELNYIKDQI